MVHNLVFLVHVREIEEKGKVVCVCEGSGEIGGG